MTDDERLSLLAKGIAALPLKIVSVAQGKAIVTEMITSVPLDRFVTVDGVLYETTPIGSEDADFRYKFRPVHDTAFDWETAK